ncbi:MAG: glycosyltransferase family 2 protein [Planctomycetota bacterium]|nr:MAG: glycosyltransferase family 2 protein [Planctomycetota bacterium]
MKLIVQIPCWNEEGTLPIALRELPREVPGFDEVEVLVVDDGSTDRTVEVARAHGVDHVVRLVTHQGLARAFQRGLLECLARGADVVVNTDADNQYCAADLPKLVEPILAGEADYVIGDRRVEELPHFSWIKKKLQRFGSYVVRVASGTDVPDTTSGFRALSRRAMLQLSVHSNYTYTHETLIQAGQKDLPVASVRIGVNPPTRPSRLFRSIPRYVLRSANTIVRIYLLYNAFRVLTRLGFGAFALSALCLAAHALWPWVGPALGAGPEPGVGWLAAAGVAFFLGTQLFVAAVLADLAAVNRRLQEEGLAYLRALTFGPPSASAPSPGGGASAEPAGGGTEEEPAGADGAEPAGADAAQATAREPSACPDPGPSS